MFQKKSYARKRATNTKKYLFNKEKIESVLPKEQLKRDKRYIEQYIIEAIKNIINSIQLSGYK